MEEATWEAKTSLGKYHGNSGHSIGGLIPKFEWLTRENPDTVGEQLARERAAKSLGKSIMKMKLPVLVHEDKDTQLRRLEKEQEEEREGLFRKKMIEKEAKLLSDGWITWETIKQDLQHTVLEWDGLLKLTSIYHNGSDEGIDSEVMKKRKRHVVERRGEAR